MVEICFLSCYIKYPHDFVDLDLSPESLKYLQLGLLHKTLADLASEESPMLLRSGYMLVPMEVVIVLPHREE